MQSRSQGTNFALKQLDINDLYLLKHFKDLLSSAVFKPKTRSNSLTKNRLLKLDAALFARLKIATRPTLQKSRTIIHFILSSYS